MDISANKNNKATVKWIVALCLTATLAIIGWTTTANLTARLRTLEEIKETAAQISATQQANTVRISVLENKYDTIQADLAEIKVLLQKLRDKLE